MLRRSPRSAVNRGASPLGFPGTRSRAPHRRHAAVAGRVRDARPRG